MEREAWYLDGPEGREGPFARSDMEHLAVIGRLEPDAPDAASGDGAPRRKRRIPSVRTVWPSLAARL